MNEQDLIKQINEQTKNLPIPDSVSPVNTKKMLDENSGEWNTFDMNTTSNDTKYSTKKRSARHFAAAACIVLCLVGSVSAIHLHKGNQNTFDSVLTAETDQMAKDETKATDTGKQSTKTDFDGDLMYQTSLQSPSSYDAYYNTLTTAYQEYYDSIATVTNRDIYLYEEDRNISVDDKVQTETAQTDTAEDSVNTSKTSSLNQTDNAKEFSSTNTQEKNVEEGDIIKTDGTYIYKIISRYNNDTDCTEQNLTITKTENGNLKAFSSIDLNALSQNNETVYLNFHEFYLYGNYIALLYTKQDDTGKNRTTETNIVLYDIKDKKNPKKIKTLTQSGWYESSRISDGFLYTISNFSETNLDTPTPYTNYIPSVNGKVIECSDIYYPRDILMQATYVITSLDLNNPTDFTDTKAVPSNSGQTYVSDSSIYFYATLYDEVTKTEITKIQYEKGSITPGESAIIAGYLYDSFALSEYDGHLRIVATIPANNISLLRVTDAISSNKTSSAVDVNEDINVLYILDDKMELTSKLSGIAPGEQIYSARFMGDIAYFVTFKNVDPLFSVDLSNPSKPKILGQLKISGFSNYLHLYDNGLLMGIGEEIDASTSEFVGLKLSMFNISNPSDVTEQDKYIIKQSQFSEVQYNHKAIMIDPEKNIFGFLYTCFDETTYDYTYYYATYTYDKEEGFIETAKYLINDGSEYETDSVRGVFIGDYLYLATNKSLTSYKIGSQQPISQIYFN